MFYMIFVDSIIFTINVDSILVIMFRFGHHIWHLLFLLQSLILFSLKLESFFPPKLLLSFVQPQPQITQMRGSNLQKELHVRRHIIQIRMATKIMTILIESNNFSGRDLHFSKYDSQTETH